MRQPILFILLAAIAAGPVLRGCEQVKRTFRTESPHESYRRALLDSKLADTPMVQQWIQAADSALSRAGAANIPQKTVLTYFKDEPVAYSWKIGMQEGRALNARIVRSDTSHQVFMDLFAIDGQDRERVASAEDSLLHYESDRDHTVILRLQPELLVSGSITLSLTDRPSMEFPVAGGSASDIKSFWGAPRDGGARRHEGVDIFAARGTPAVAAAGGRVSRTGTSSLGGNIVWLRANGRALYYAHLDSVIARSMQQVRSGDTLGLVGNTGNARTTPPHLHFGIYDNGAINPLPFIDDPAAAPAGPSASSALLGKWARVRNAKANVRPLPSTQKPPVTSLNRNDAVRVLGVIGNWYKVELPDQRKGYIYSPLLSSAKQPLASVSTAAGDSLFEYFTARRPLLRLDSSPDLGLHATFNGKQLIEYNGRMMWRKQGR